jgi:nucleoid DNA-binding protein
MDKQNDLLFNALAGGKGIKVSGLGTLEVRSHEERDYVLPDGTKGTSDAGLHVKFVESDKLKAAINTTEA